MSWRKFFRRKQSDADLLEEMNGFIAEEVAENRLRGMSEEEARRQARIKFGSPVVARESLWRQNSIPSLDNLLRDLRYAARALFRTPGFSLVAIGVMALCIGATTSLFTVVRSVLLRPLPFRDPSQLIVIFEHFHALDQNSQGFNYNPVSPADFYDWRAQTHGFEDMAAMRYSQFNLTGEHGEMPEAVTARGGSWNLFPLLGVNAAIGRTFTESEDSNDGTAVLLTWSLFERRFGGDPSLVGRQIHLDGKPYTVVGVLPRWFAYPDAEVQLWVPYLAGLPPEIVHHHDFHFSKVLARLRPGVSLASAMSQVDAVQYQLHLQYPHDAVAEEAASKTLIQDLARDVTKPLIILMSAVACMLLIGCLNVANLLVARSAARHKEIAIRSALGARRATLIRVQLAESFLVAIAGGIAGALLSIASTRWLAANWNDLPSAQSIHVDATVLAFACALVFTAALLAGLLPAISSTGKSSLAALQPSTRGAAGSQSRTTLRKTLLTVEIAVTVVLLIGAGLLLKSFWLLRTTNLGCATGNMLTMSYSLPAAKYSSPDKVNAFNEDLLAHVRAMPGVRAAALASELPGQGDGEDDVFDIVEHPPVPAGAPLVDALYRTVDPGFFTALEIPLLRGRFFLSSDRAGGHNAIIISRMLAQQYFPGENPLGKHLHITRNKADYEIVGVVADTLYQVGQPLRPAMYLPVLLGDTSVGGLTLAVRTATDPLAFSVPIQKLIAGLDPELPVSDVQTMEQIVEQSLGNQSLSASLVLAFAVLSLLLASVGLYGVLSYLGTQRTGEIGVRMALGAERGQVMRLMLGDGLRPALYGLVLGAGASVGAVRLIQSMLYETRPLDPAIFAAVGVVLLAVAALACIVPAWKASHIDPMQALRME